MTNNTNTHQSSWIGQIIEKLGGGTGIAAILIALIGGGGIGAFIKPDSGNCNIPNTVNTDLEGMVVLDKVNEKPKKIKLICDEQKNIDIKKDPIDSNTTFEDNKLLMKLVDKNTVSVNIQGTPIGQLKLEDITKNSSLQKEILKKINIRKYLEPKHDNLVVLKKDDGQPEELKLKIDTQEEILVQKAKLNIFQHIKLQSQVSQIDQEKQNIFNQNFLVGYLSRNINKKSIKSINLRKVIIDEIKGQGQTITKSLISYQDFGFDLKVTLLDQNYNYYDLIYKTNRETRSRSGQLKQGEFHFYEVKYDHGYIENIQRIRDSRISFKESYTYFIVSVPVANHKTYNKFAWFLIGEIVPDWE